MSTIKELSQQIQEKKNQKPSTVDVNLSRMKKIMLGIGFVRPLDVTLKELEGKEDKIKEFLKNLDQINTKKAYTSALYTYLDFEGRPQGLDAFFKHIKEEKNSLIKASNGELASQQKRDKDKRKYLVTNDMQSIRDLMLQYYKDNFEGYLMEFGNKNAKYVDFVLVSLYVFHPPRRTEYWNMDVADSQALAKDKAKNYYIPDTHTFVFHQYKTSRKYGTQVVKVEDPTLIEILDQYMWNHELQDGKHFLMRTNYKPFGSGNELSKRVVAFLKVLHNAKSKEKSVGSINLLRHFAIEEFRSKHSRDLQACLDLAAKMGHCLKTQAEYDRWKESEAKDATKDQEGEGPEEDLVQDSAQKFSEQDQVPDEKKPNIESLLQKLYYEQKNLIGLERLYKLAKEQDDSITRDEVGKWLRKQEIYQLTKQQPMQVPVRSIIAKAPYKKLAIDLQVFENQSTQNRGYKYLFVAVDLFTKYAYTATMKRKTPADVVEAFHAIEKDPQYKKYGLVISDQGSEFKGVFTKYLKEIDSKHLFLNPAQPWQNNSERFNKTFKMVLKKLWLQNDNENWIDHYKDITDNYNNTFHATLKATPLEAFAPERHDWIFENILASSEGQDASEDESDLEVGDPVRLALRAETFERDAQTYSKNVYKIDRVIKGRSGRNGQGKIRYRISDAKGVLLLGEYDRSELQHVPVIETAPELKAEEKQEQKQEQKQEESVSEVVHEDPSKPQQRRPNTRAQAAKNQRAFDKEIETELKDQEPSRPKRQVKVKHPLHFGI